MRTEEKIICNCCKKVIRDQNFPFGTEYLHVEKEWGYFSNKDGERQEFDLCESCYDTLIRKFQIPVASQEIIELL
ncbi:hypothetical protein D3Z36_03770 [Lachnospiraceae bacterium]|nr:hypothetical protein [Lachnospiraceae bacterium]